LVTPDEVTRLGPNEALIFTSGQPAIRATKIRYYTEPFFKRRAALQPPSKTDRIANSSANEKAANETALSPISSQVTPDTEGYQSQRESSFLAKAAEPPPNRQLTFLKFAVDHGDSTAVATNRGRKKERLL
jgi:type IV secretory system conjugative DNA transfer VirD4/TraG family protein